MDKLQGRNAVITGAGGGMGRAIALSLAAEGVNVAIADIDGAAARSVAAEAQRFDVATVAVQTDVSQLASVSMLKDATVSALGGIDILVNNAGVTMRPFRASWDASHRDYEWMMDVNYWGVVHGFMAFVPGMRASPGDKHIVNTSSMATLEAMKGHAPYSASKAAMEAFSHCAREEFRSAGIPIDVTILFPGAVRSRIGTSERLRPADERSDTRKVRSWSSYVPHEASRGAENKEIVTDLLALRSHSEPIEPNHVGPMVVEAIRRRHRYVLTHPSAMEHVERANEVAGSFRPATRGT